MRETKDLLKKAITKQNEFIAIFGASQHPQDKLMVAECKANRNAFQAALDSLNKSHAMLKTYIY
jgi:hypothetical protein